MTTLRSQAEAARMLDLPESTLRSWVKRFKPYVVIKTDASGHKVYDVERLQELNYVCNVWAKTPPRRTLREVGHELARRYPEDAARAKIQPPPEPDFDSLGGGKPSAALAPAWGDALDALLRLPELLRDHTDAINILAEGSAAEQADLADLKAQASDLQQIFAKLETLADGLGAMAPMVEQILDAERRQEAREEQMLALLLSREHWPGQHAFAWAWLTLVVSPTLFVLAVLHLRPSDGDDASDGDDKGTPVLAPISSSPSPRRPREAVAHD